MAGRRGGGLRRPGGASAAPRRRRAPGAEDAEGVVVGGLYAQPLARRHRLGVVEPARARRRRRLRGRPPRPAVGAARLRGAKASTATSHRGGCLARARPLRLARDAACAPHHPLPPRPIRFCALHAPPSPTCRAPPAFSVEPRLRVVEERPRHAAPALADAARHVAAAAARRPPAPPRRRHRGRDPLPRRHALGLAVAAGEGGRARRPPAQRVVHVVRAAAAPPHTAPPAPRRPADRSPLRRRAAG